MSLFNALSVGVSGLLAQSNNVNIISNNIANGTTVGYKENTASFSELIADDPAPNYLTSGVVANSSSTYAPGGVAGGIVQSVTTAGTYVGTSSSTDMAINGNGLIPVSANNPSNGDILYTRAGSFTEDANGNFVNTAGFFLQAWPLDSSGNLPAALTATNVDSSTAIAALQTVNVPEINEIPVASTNVTIKSNLNSDETAYSSTTLPYDPTSATADMSSGAVSADFTAVATVTDSEGNQHTVNVGFLKTAANTWAVEVYPDPASDITAGSTTGPAPQLAAGTITFNGDGTLASVSPSLDTISATWANGAAPSSIAFNWGTAGAEGVGQANGVAQFDGAYTQNVTADGSGSSAMTGVSINNDGYVSANFADGSSRNIYKIPVTTFIEPDQLQAQTGNVYAQSTDSGVPVFHQSGTGGAGQITGKELEQSNVDLSTQLTSLIIAQNAYSSNSKLVSVTDTMLEDLDQMVV